MSQQLAPKQKVTIDIEFYQDWDIGNMEYNDLIAKRQIYLDRGFSLEQAKYFNRTFENTISDIENDTIICLDVRVTASYKVSCGHYEESFDSLGGCWYNWRTDNLDETFYAITDHDMIGNVKREVIEKLGTDNIEFELNVNSEIKVNY